MSSPRYTVPALCSHALGIGASTAVLAVVSALLLRPLPFRDEGRLVEIGFSGVTFNEAGQLGLTMSESLTREIGEMTSTFASVGSHRSIAARLTGLGEPKRVAVEEVSPNFLRTLGGRPAQGRIFSEGDRSDVLILRHQFWQSAFGGEPVVGKTVRLDGEPKTIVGVLPDDQAIPVWTDVWMPRPMRAEAKSLAWKGIARLVEGVPLEDAQERLQNFSRKLEMKGFEGEPLEASLRPLREGLVAPQRGSVALMVAAVVAFLLLACANSSALMATRASVRRHERAVRAALGASRVTLARQDLIEAGLIALVGGLLGLGLASLALGSLDELYLEALGNTPPRIDAQVALGVMGLVGLATLSGGLAPMLSARRVRPMDALRGEGRSSPDRRARKLRETLVTVQMTVTVVLLIGAGLLIRSVDRLLAVETGLDPEGVVTAYSLLSVQTPPAEDQGGWLARVEEMQAKHTGILKQLQALPGARSASVSLDTPFDFLVMPEAVELEEGAKRREAQVIPHFVGPGFFQTFGIRLLSGRKLHHGAQELPSPLVNQAFARQLLGVEDAVGHRMRWKAPPGTEGRTMPWLEIRGMVSDALEASLDEAPRPSVYYALATRPVFMVSKASSMLSLAVNSSADPELISARLAGAVAQVDPGASVFLPRPLEETIKRSYWKRRTLRSILTALSIAATVLAVIGLFGVTSYSVAQRSHEIGIRRALGASRKTISRMVLRETSAAVGLALVFGGLLAWLAQSLLEPFLFGVSGTDWVTYAVVAAGVAVVGTLAAVFPARVAASVTPSRALSAR